MSDCKFFWTRQFSILTLLPLRYYLFLFLIFVKNFICFLNPKKQQPKNNNFYLFILKLNLFFFLLVFLYKKEAALLPIFYFIICILLPFWYNISSLGFVVIIFVVRPFKCLAMCLAGSCCCCDYWSGLLACCCYYIFLCYYPSISASLTPDINTPRVLRFVEIQRARGRENEVFIFAAQLDFAFVLHHYWVFLL